MKVLYLALAGGSPEHEAHQKAQESTWAGNHDQSSRVIWIYGDATISTPKLSVNRLYLPVEERYENLLEKTILGVRWALENVEFEYLIRTNTSNYFHTPLVNRHLSRFQSSENKSGGVIADWRGTIQGVKKNHSYISGAGIYLSKKSVEILESLEFENYFNIPDDVAIGHWLGQNGTKFLPIPRNNVTDFKLVWPTPQTRVKSWNYPEVTSRRMHEIHNLYHCSSRIDLINSLNEFRKNEESRCKLEKPRRQYLFGAYLFITKNFVRRVFANELKRK